MSGFTEFLHWSPYLEQCWRQEWRDLEWTALVNPPEGTPVEAQLADRAMCEQVSLEMMESGRLRAHEFGEARRLAETFGQAGPA